MACQVVEVSPHESEGEATLAKEVFKLNFYESDSKGEDDPLVSGPVSPLATQVDIVEPHLGVRGVVKALIDLGAPNT